MITYCINDYSTDFSFKCSKTNNLIALAYVLHKFIHLIPDIDSSISFRPYTIVNFNLALNRFVVIVDFDHSISLKAATNTAFHSHSNRHKHIATLLAVAAESKKSGSSCWSR